MPLVVRPATVAELPVCLEIRHEVFIVGQGVPSELEVDGLDPAAHHVLALYEGRPVGTARLRLVDGAGKVERVAVLASERGRGIGADIMREIHAIAAGYGVRVLKLNAQLPVLGFYEQLGYVAYGRVFLDAGIEHRAMRCELPG